jgi:hypothetical protein
VLKMPVPKLSNPTSTQTHLDIEDIINDLVILKNGGAALVLQTTAVNFGLLSETEQDAAIYAYAGLLNSLTFPVQIIIRSKGMDISSYLDLLKSQEEKQANENLRYQIKKYREFIESIIKENKVLDKRFYIVVLFSPLELGAAPTAVSFLDLLNPFARKKRGGLPFPKSHILEKAKNALYPKRDHIVRQLARIGLKAEQLTTQQLVELFYDIYNPIQAGGPRLTGRATDYVAPIVAPATEEPGPSAFETQTPIPIEEKQATPGQMAATTKKIKEEEELKKKEEKKSEEILYKAEATP